MKIINKGVLLLRVIILIYAVRIAAILGVAAPYANEFIYYVCLVTIIAAAGGFAVKIGNEQVKPTDILWSITLVTLFVLLSNGVFAALRTCGMFPDFSVAKHNAEMMEGVNLRWMSLLRTCILAPIIEEFMFRHHILNTVKAIFNGNEIIAIAIQAMVFGAMHTVSPSHVISTFFIGIALGIVAVKYKNLGLVILLHSVSNFVNILT